MFLSAKSFALLTHLGVFVSCMVRELVRPRLHDWHYYISLHLSCLLYGFLLSNTFCYGIDLVFSCLVVVHSRPWCQCLLERYSCHTGGALSVVVCILFFNVSILQALFHELQLSRWGRRFAYLMMSGIRGMGVLLDVLFCGRGLERFRRHSNCWGWEGEIS